MAMTGKFLYMAHHVILLQLNLFDVGVDKKRWWFEHISVIVVGLLDSKGCQKRFLVLALLTPKIGYADYAIDW